MVEERLSRLEGTYEQADKRLDDMNQSINALRTDMSRSIDALRTELHDSMTALRNEMSSRINNLYIVTFGLWMTTVLAIVGLYFKG